MRRHDQKSKNVFCLFLLIIGTCLLIIPAAADTNPFGIAGDYNGFIFGDVNHVGGLSQGALALGGDATFSQNYSVGTLLPSGGNSDGIGLVVGGNSTWTKNGVNSGQVFEGDMYVGGSVLHENVSVLNGTLYAPSTPIDFNLSVFCLKSLSAYWTNLSSTPGTTVILSGNLLNLTGTNSNFNIFHVSDSQWQSTRQVNLTVPSGSSVIINVNGTTDVLPHGGSFDMYINGNTSGAAWQAAIWNFHSMTSMDMSNIDWKGSIMAPYADFSYKKVNLEGHLVAKSLDTTNTPGKSELHLYPFIGDFPVPNIIHIEKLTNGQNADNATGPVIQVGSNVTWTYLVNNTGNVNITNITVTDDQGITPVYRSGDNGDNILQPGEVWIYNATGIATEGQYTNIGNATGKSLCRVENHTDEDPSHYFGFNTSIDIEKSTNGYDADTGTGPVIPIGNNVTWTYVINNTGNVPLINISVYDDKLGIISCPKTSLNVSESMNCSVTGVSVEGQYANNGTAMGDYNGFSVNDTDPSHYFGANASIDIEKLTNGYDADNATGPVIPIGNNVTWNYVINNTGNVPLINISVYDDKLGAISCPKTSLNVSESMNCSVTGVSVEGQYANNGTAMGDYNGFSVNDTDPSHYFGANASIDIEKSTNGYDADTETGPIIPIGSNVTWTYNVTNTGNVNLTNINVSDDKLGVITCPKTSLNVSESMNCSVIGTAALGQYINNATVTGDYNGFSVNDTDPSHYLGANASIDLEKLTNDQDADTGTGPAIQVGNNVTWTYVISNTGNVPLVNISVYDDRIGNIICPKTSLNVSESMNCSVTGVSVEGQYVNNGTATGDYNGFSVNDTDPSHYRGVNASIDIEKSTNGYDADTAPGPTIQVGSNVTWTYVVTNTGNVSLTNISVYDDRIGNIICPKTSLNVSESMNCSVTGTAALGQYVNNATVTGHYNSSVTDTDSSYYLGEEGSGPSIDIEKSTNGQDADTVPGPTIPVGNNVTWTYVVNNTGDVNLTNITVTDDQGVIPVYRSGDDGDNILQPGEIWIYNATGNATLGQYENIGNATGQYNGTNYSDEDPSHYCGAASDFLRPVYALLNVVNDQTIAPQFAFFDYNIGGGNPEAFDNSDSGYIDMDGDGIIDPNIDIRITPWHNVPVNDPQYKYPANTKVANDLDQGLPIFRPGTDGPGTQVVLYFIDLYNDGYDIEDPIYVDVNSAGLLNSIVEVHDIRLTANGWGYNAYTTVGAYDTDKGQLLTLMPDNPDNPEPQGTFADLLSYIDDDCSTTWTCPDKLYLQQPKNTVEIPDFDTNANFFVTIGDLRIYIPPEAIENDCWPSCGTKVEEGDIDAVYTLSTPTDPATGQIGVAIGYHDFNDNGVFDGIDSAYVDIVNVPLLPGPGIPGTVDNGDVRITPWHNVPEENPDFKYPANTKVINDLDQGMPLLYPAQEGLITFFDINNAGNQPGYDISDPLYVDMDSNNIISIYDIRLTPREEYGYKAYTTVQAGDLDLYDPWPFWPVGEPGVTPAQLIAYIDDDCSGTWTCTDKLYLEQPIYDITTGTPLGFDHFVTIGDMRLYIPPEAIANEGWPSCGTKVGFCDVEAVYVLKNLGIENAELKFYDYDGDGVFDNGDTLYIDVDNSNNVIEAGDLRLTPWHNVPADDPDFKYPANTKVANDLDLNKPLIAFTPGVDYNVAYFDINGDGALDLCDPFYIDIAPLGHVSLFDVRLTSTAGYDAYTSVRAGDLDLIENRVLSVHPLGGAISASIGYIDTDCSDTWTCVDKLYLNQQFPPLPVPVQGLVGFVTIGDMRLHDPPGKVNGNNGGNDIRYHPYDKNKNNIIDMPELMSAIGDWKARSLSIGELMDIIGYWKARHIDF